MFLIFELVLIATLIYLIVNLLRYVFVKESGEGEHWLFGLSNILIKKDLIKKDLIKKERKKKMRKAQVTGCMKWLTLLQKPNKPSWEVGYDDM